MNTILDEIKDSFKTGSTLTRLIYINVGVFLIVNLFRVIFFLLNLNDAMAFSVINWLAVPADLSQLLVKPWTLVTYMFLHENFIHILFNLLILFWFGKIFLMYLDQKKLLSVYLVGGLSGAVLYIAAYNVFPVFAPFLSVSKALGASAAVMAVVISISVYMPDFNVHLLFLGRVKLKYIALAYIVLDVISIASSNAGGHIAHLGGAMFGFLYIKQYQKGKNLTRGFDRMMDNLFSFFKPRKKMKVSYKRPVSDYEYNEQKVKKQKNLDEILEKISKSGYDSLTKKEKEILFHMGNKK